MGERLVFDVETDGLYPSVIWMVGIFNIDTREYRDYVLDDVADGLMRLSQADVVIGHNIKGYDLPVIKRLTEGLIVIEDDKIVDTLELSRKLFPDLKDHKLKTWGDVFDYPKKEWTVFDCYDEGMRPYMQRDVEVNTLLVEFLIEHTNANA